MTKAAQPRIWPAVLIVAGLIALAALADLWDGDFISPNMFGGSFPSVLNE